MAEKDSEKLRRMNSISVNLLILGSANEHAATTMPPRAVNRVHAEPEAGYELRARPPGVAVGIKPPAVAQPDQPPPAPKVQMPKVNAVTIDAEKMLAKMEEAVVQLNKMAVNSGRGLTFQADPKLGRHVITVTNPKPVKWCAPFLRGKFRNRDGSP